MQPPATIPHPPSRPLPFWAWILILLCGCAVLTVIGLSVTAIWLGATDNPVMRNVYAQSNPDFEILEYAPRKMQLHVRHKASNRQFRVYLASLRNNRIDYRTLATKMLPTPGWAAYPDAKSRPGMPATTSASQTQVLNEMTMEFLEHNYSEVKGDDANREFCNFDEIEYAILATSRTSSGETFYSVTFYGPPDK